MSSTIEETIEQALAKSGLGSYARQAGPVVDALVRRESQIATDLIGFASQKGLSEAEATEAIRATGLCVPTTGTLASADAQNQAGMAGGEPGGDDLTATLARINATLEDLSGFARQNGWRPTS